MLGESRGERPIKSCDFVDATALAGSQMKEVTRSKTGVTSSEQTGRPYVFGFDSPHDGNGGVGEIEGCIERREALDRKVRMQQFLKHFSRGNERTPLLDRTFEECPGPIPQGVRAADRIHQDVGIDEDHVPDCPRAIDR